MAESEDYNAENEDYKRRGGETEITGDDVTGDEGLLEIEIPAARYGDGKVATAQDSDLTAGNIKKDVVIFGVTGTLEAESTDGEKCFPLVSTDDGLATGAVFSTGNLWWYFGNRNGSDRNAFVRCPLAFIPQGATIKTAVLRIKIDTTHAESKCNINCYFNDIDDAISPTTATALNALAVSAAVGWADIPTQTAGGYLYTPDLADILQEVIDREGWESGNALMVILKIIAATQTRGAEVFR